MTASRPIQASQIGVVDFVGEYNTAHLKNSLLEFPGKILEQKALIRKAKDDFRDADQPRQLLELEMIDDIAAAKDPDTGKAKFSNDKLRESELMRRKVASIEYQELRARGREAGRELAAAEDELEALVDKFKATRYIAQLMAAELAVIASGQAEEWGAEEDRWVPTDKAYTVDSATKKERISQPY